MKRLQMCWHILTCKRYWLYYRTRKGGYMAEISKGWNGDEAREMVKDIHKRVFKSDMSAVKTAEAKENN